jgi:hypothetical protein
MLTDARNVGRARRRLPGAASTGSPTPAPENGSSESVDGGPGSSSTHRAVPTAVLPPEATATPAVLAREPLAASGATPPGGDTPAPPVSEAEPSAAETAPVPATADRPTGPPPAVAVPLLRAAPASAAAPAIAQPTNAAAGQSTAVPASTLSGLAVSTAEPEVAGARANAGIENPRAASGVFVSWNWLAAQLAGLLTAVLALLTRSPRRPRERR